ncbi:hypothetical protein ABW20_dc0101933 [Dactylellina cionopaga]|nr:hypothetical protein ABW20_dc0101933 [Dactylellina cionopaga]
MAKLLLSRSRSKSEGRLRGKAKDAAKSSESLSTSTIALSQAFHNEPLPNPQYIPRNLENLTAESYAIQKRSFDVSRPKTSSSNRDGTSKTEDRPKTSHGPKKDSALEEPNFSILNRSYTWSREQSSIKSGSPTQRQTSSPMLHAFPPRASSRQRDHTPSCEIGVALGSPSYHPKTLSDARSSRMYGPDDLYSRSLPQHYISLDDKMRGPVPVSSSDVVLAPENKETTSKGGWKRFFGKSLFQKKSPQKSLQSQTLTSQSSITTVSSTNFNNIQDTKGSMDSFRGDSPVEEAVQPDVLPDQKPKFDASPLLDVDIPKVEMERYSSENCEATPMLSLPKKDNLPVGQLGLVNKSPLWLFPATPRTPKSPGRPRAMTTPTEMAAGSPSTTPEAVTFKKSRPESDIVPSLLMMLEERIERNSSKIDKDPQTPFSVISESSELDSPYSPNGAYEIGSPDRKAPWVRKFSMVDEPEWEMITTTPLRPRTPSPTEVDQLANEGEAYVAKAAKISIARQISISQRQLLLPVISHPERFVSRSKSLKSQHPQHDISLVITPVKPETTNPAPTSAVSAGNIAMAL